MLTLELSQQYIFIGVVSSIYRIKNINKSFGDFKASDNVSFGIEKGKLIGLLGPSGSGKTTILRMLAGLEKQDSGDIIIDGKNVNKLPSNERGIGFVFQSYALFPFMTVYDNIAYGLKVQKKDKKFIKQHVLSSFLTFASIAAKGSSSRRSSG